MQQCPLSGMSYWDKVAVCSCARRTPPRRRRPFDQDRGSMGTTVNDFMNFFNNAGGNNFFTSSTYPRNMSMHFPGEFSTGRGNSNSIEGGNGGNDQRWPPDINVNEGWTTPMYYNNRPPQNISNNSRTNPTDLISNIAKYLPKRPDGSFDISGIQNMLSGAFGGNSMPKLQMNKEESMMTLAASCKYLFSEN